MNTQAKIGSEHVSGITYANASAKGRTFATSATEAGEWTIAYNVSDYNGVTKTYKKNKEQT